MHTVMHIGRISPNGEAFVALVLSAKTQPLAICERLKIMVRELLRANNKSRAGQRLLDKIKKKVTFVLFIINFSPFFSIFSPLLIFVVLWGMLWSGLKGTCTTSLCNA